MTKKPVIKVNPIDLIYIDESELQTKTDDEEWQDAYDMGDRPADYASVPASRAAFEEFMKRKNYDLSA